LATIPNDAEAVTHAKAIRSHVSALVKQIDTLKQAPTDPISLAERILRFHQRATRDFGYHMTSMPGLIMLIDLLIAERKRRRVSISSLCIASGVPPTPALRWIRVLEDDALVKKCDHPSDRRVAWVELTDAAREMLIALLSRWY